MAAAERDISEKSRRHSDNICILPALAEKDAGYSTPLKEVSS